MTKEQVIALCLEVQALPYAVLVIEDDLTADGLPRRWVWELAYAEYWHQLGVDSQWCGPHGEWAWYEDELSEACQDYWHKKASEAGLAVREWERTHKGKVPKWALPRATCY